MAIFCYNAIIVFLLDLTLQTIV